jgi:F0F1-type ATP synthase assembly protein I
VPAEPSDKRRLNFLRTFALAMELPFILVGGVVIGGGLGYWLDKQIGTSPALTFVLGIVGFAAGVREVLRRLPEDDQGQGGSSGENGEGDSGK